MSYSDLSDNVSKNENDLVIGKVRFKILNTLGKGSYGKVYRVKILNDDNFRYFNKNIPSNEEYALKIIENDLPEGILSLRELDVMSRIIHPGIANSEMIVSDTYLKTNKGKKPEPLSRVGIVMKIADRDLYTAIYNDELSLLKKLKLMKQVSRGLKYLHDSDYLHLDVKPLNILLYDDDTIAELTDFGLALKLMKKDDKWVKHYPNPLTTIDHRSINILNGDRNYTKADDIWSLGITLLETLSGRSLFENFKSEDYITEKIKKVFIDKLSSSVIDQTLEEYLDYLPKTRKKNAIELLKKMLRFNPESRISIEEVLKSKLFKKINEENGKERKEKSFRIGKNECCTLLTYKGFDFLVRLATKFPISFETFYLAGDIFQRTLSHRGPLTGNEEKDYKNIRFLAALSLYIAMKMIETFFTDPEEFQKYSGNVFTVKQLIDGEAALINEWNGKIYHTNLFNISDSFDRLNKAFEILRNCDLYRKIDLEKWKEYNEEEIENGEFKKYNKYISFVSFLSNTPYYANMFDETRSYIKMLYDEDRKK